MRRIRARAIIAFLFLFTPSLRAADSVVVFNEIMYHPGAGDAVEWVELYNEMAVDVELSGWEIEGIGFTFPTNTIIAGGQYLVVASDPAELSRRTGLTNVFGPFTGRLANEGERLRLRNHNHRIMDSVAYDSRFPWPAGADGTGFSLAKRAPNLASRAGENWRASQDAGGTPGKANFPAGLDESTVVISELPGAANRSGSFWVELLNRGSAPVDISDFRIGFSKSQQEIRIEQGTVLAAGQFFVAQSPLYYPDTNEKLFLFGPERRVLLDAVAVEGRGKGRHPDFPDRFLYFSTNTPGTENVFVLEKDIVINEIMFRDGAQGSNSWVELYNKGTRAVDLGGWRLDGPDFLFPLETIFDPGGYLVIARDTNSLSADLSGIRVLGNFPDALGRSSGRVTLLDRAGNPADEVRYDNGSPWPEVSDGMSIELRDPRADNARPESWTASRAPGEWQSYSYTAAAAPDNGPTRWNEFIFGLLDAGEVLLDDFSVVEDPAGTRRELLQNGSFEKGAAAWRFLGTHRGASIIPDPANPANHVLYLRADGPTEHMHNHVETTLLNNAPIQNGRTYRISWRAKWLSGCNKLNTRLYFNRVARTTELQRAALVATPGRVNSASLANAGPSFTSLRHTPAVPKAGQPVVVSVRASDPDGVSRCTLWFGVNGTNWASVPMTQQGGNGFTASLPGGLAGTTVQFYIEAEDQRGAVASFPAAGRESRALYKVNDKQALSSKLHNVRLWMIPAEATALHTATNVMSNGRSRCTVVYDDDEVFYDCTVHLQSSERGRMDASRVGFTVGFPSDHLFRGVQDTITFDRSGGWSGRGGRQDEIIMRHIINQAGDSPDMYNDLVRLLAPQTVHTGTAMLLMSKYGGNYLDGSVYPDGGSLFKLELIYYPLTSVNNNPELPKIPQPDEVTGTDLGNFGTNHEAYRWFFLAENHEGQDEYDRFIPLSQLFSLSGVALQKKAAELIDIEQWTRVFAFKSLSGDADTYGFGLPHNQLFYIPPAGRALTFPWDMDFSWARGPAETINVSARAGQLIHTIPAHQRLYLGNLLDIVNTSYNTNYIARWTAHYGSLAGENYSGILTYIGQRAASVRRQLPPPAAFRITSFSGQDFTTNSSSVVLRGTAPYTFKQLQRNDDSPGAGFTWPAVETWETTVSLQPGPNRVSITGYDFHGNALATNSITITLADPAKPDQDGDGMPDEWERLYALNPGVPDGTVDSDGDGLSNLAEYIAGTSPIDARSGLRVEITRSDAMQFMLQFPAVKGRTYRLQYSVGLNGNWRDLLRIPAVAADQLFAIPQTITPVASSLYYRVLVEAAAP